MAVNVNNTQNICSVTQNNEAQSLMDFICPKLCNYFNDYLLLTASEFANTTQAQNSGTADYGLEAVTNQLRSYVNMVVEFFNISQYQAIGYLYDNCTLPSGLSFMAGCKVRPNSSIIWNDILGQAPSNEAGLKVDLIDIPVVNTNTSTNNLITSLSSEDLSNEVFLDNTNLIIDESLNVRPR